MPVVTPQVLDSSPNPGGVGGVGGTPYDGLHREASPESRTFFRLQLCERVGVSLVEVHKRVGQSVTRVCKRAQKG